MFFFVVIWYGIVILFLAQMTCFLVAMVQWNDFITHVDAIVTIAKDNQVLDFVPYFLDSTAKGVSVEFTCS